MFEMTKSRHCHCHVVLLAVFYAFFVVDTASGLDNSLDTFFVCYFYAIREWKEGIGDIRFARAVGSEQAKDLAGGDVQVEVVERDKVVIALDEIFDVDDVCHEAALLLVVARYDCIIAGAGSAHQ